MKQSVKAVILSAFVCPGAGHLYLKKTIIGWSLLAITLIALSIVMVQVFTVAMGISQDIINGLVAPDIVEIRKLIAARQSEEMTLSSSRVAIYVLIAVWLIGVFDSYRIGRLKHTND